MADKYLIGVDIGTQGTKTSLFTEKGEVVSQSFEESNLISRKPGEVEQNPEEIYSSVRNTIRSVMEASGIDPAKVVGIGLDGQMAGVIGIDDDWNAVTPYDSWLDTRCEKYIRYIKEKAEERVIEITGCPVTFAHGPKILWWKKERPEVYRKISKFIMPTTYVCGKLSGLQAKEAYIDYTHLHFSGFGDVEKKEWSQELLALFDLEAEKMPDIVEPWKIIGCITADEAEKCGLVQGIPVVAGCGDQAATSLGAGITRQGMIFDVAGTASVFSCCVDSYTPDVKNKTLLFARSVIDGLWIPLAYINGGGLCLKWFRDNLTCNEAKISFKDLDSEAQSVEPGSEGLIFIPHFGGRVCPNNPHVRGSWIGLNWSHKRKHLFRAIMEGIAYEYSYYLSILKNLMGGFVFQKVFSIGGGAKSRLFNSIKADVLGIPYTSLKNPDTATLGSAIVAGYGVKIYSDIAATVEEIIEPQDFIEPNFQNNKEYSRFVKIYKGLFGALENTFEQINQKSN